MFHSSKIHVALCFDKNFLTPFYVLITSIFENNKTKTSIVFHAIVSGIDVKEKGEINDYVQRNGGEINFYSLSDDYIRTIMPPGEARHGTSAYYRLFFPSVLPDNIIRYLYLDIDIIVLGDLFELFNTSFAPAPIAAASDQDFWHRNGRGMGSFFNTGVLLVDRERWQEQQLTERCIDFMRDYPKLIIYADQDALNGVIEDNWYELKEIYNFTFRSVPFLPHKEYANILKYVVIVHYNQSAKPWHRLNPNPLGYLYKVYFDKSPQINKVLYRDFVWTKANVIAYGKLWVSRAYFKSPTLVKFWRKLKKVVKVIINRIMLFEIICVI